MEFFYRICGLLCVGMGQEKVFPGIMDFGKYETLLQGKRVALAANQTSVVTTYDWVGERKNEPALSSHTLDFCGQRAYMS